MSCRGADLLLLRPPCFLCPQYIARRSCNSATRKPKTSLLRKLKSSQVICNCSSDYTLDKQFSNGGNGSPGRDRNTSPRVINEWMLLKGGESWKKRIAHWQSIEIQHCNAMGSDSQELPHIFPLFDFYIAEIILELLHSLIQVLPSHISSSHLDLLSLLLCGQPLPSPQNFQSQGNTYCRTHQITQWWFLLIK